MAYFYCMMIKTVITFLFISCTLFVHAQRIAITFDDAPMFSSPLFTTHDRAERINRHLIDNGVKACFFVITSNVSEATQRSLTRYAQNGHLLANHSHSHYSLSRVSASKYINDIRLADSVMNLLPNTRRWFRYPYLNEGPSRPVRDSVRTGLRSLGLTNGYVTIDNYDWFLNGQLIQALREKRNIDYQKLKDVYITHILESIKFYDDIARKTIARSPSHVLLLHENDLAALFLPDLIKALRDGGWQIISPDEAYEDPIAAITPDVLFNGQGRVGAIAFEKGAAADSLVQISEDEGFLLQLLTDAGVFK